MADYAIDDDDYPGSLGCADLRDRRRGMLEERRVARLTKYAEELRRMGRGEVPDFDPLNGGAEAQNKLEQALQENLKLRRELAANVTKAEARITTDWSASPRP